MLEEYKWYDIGLYYELGDLPFVLTTDGSELPAIAAWRPEGSAWMRSPSGWYSPTWDRSFIPNPIAFMKLPKFEKPE